MPVLLQGTCTPLVHAHAGRTQYDGPVTCGSRTTVSTSERARATSAGHRGC